MHECKLTNSKQFWIRIYDRWTSGAKKGVSFQFEIDVFESNNFIAVENENDESSGKIGSRGLLSFERFV